MMTQTATIQPTRQPAAVVPIDQLRVAPEPQAEIIELKPDQAQQVSQGTLQTAVVYDARSQQSTKPTHKAKAQIIHVPQPIQRAHNKHKRAAQTVAEIIQLKIDKQQITSPDQLMPEALALIEQFGLPAIVAEMAVKLVINANAAWVAAAVQAEMKAAKQTQPSWADMYARSVAQQEGQKPSTLLQVEKNQAPAQQQKNRKLSDLTVAELMALSATQQDNPYMQKAIAVEMERKLAQAAASQQQPSRAQGAQQQPMMHAPAPRGTQVQQSSNGGWIVIVHATLYTRDNNSYSAHWQGGAPNYEAAVRTAEEQAHKMMQALCTQHGVSYKGSPTTITTHAPTVYGDQAQQERPRTPAPSQAAQAARDRHSLAA